MIVFRVVCSFQDLKNYSFLRTNLLFNIPEGHEYNFDYDDFIQISGLHNVFERSAVDL